MLVFRSVTETTHLTTTEPITRMTGGARRNPGTATFPGSRCNQDEGARELTTFGGPELMRFVETIGVDECSLALPLPQYTVGSFQWQKR
jgi:alkylresorcinol/alkylpyrone synthase